MMKSKQDSHAAYKALAEQQIPYEEIIKIIVTSIRSTARLTSKTQTQILNDVTDRLFEAGNEPVSMWVAK